MKTETVKIKNTRSLTTSLAISFFSLSALVLLLSSSLQIVLTIQTRQREIEDRQLLIAQDAGKSVSNFIQEKLNTMAVAIEFSEPFTASPANQTTVLQAMLGLDPAFKQIVLLDDKGKQSAFVSRVSQRLSSQFIAQINDDTLSQTAEGRRYIGSVYIDDKTSEPLILLAIPVTTVLGEYQGTLATEVNLKFIWDLVDQIQVGDTGYVYVVDSQGNLVAYRDTTLVLQGANASHISEVGMFVENPLESANITPSIQTYTGLSEETVVGTHIPLEAPQWAVVIELPWREAYQNVITLGIRSLFLILVVAALAGLAGYFGARRTSAPLIDLSNVATEISAGNLGVRANEIGSTELVQLAGSFNTMTSQLRDLIGNLEQRVADRTSELNSARVQSEERAQNLQSIGEISRIISGEQRLDILLPLITRLVSEKFYFYHTGIFFVDDSRRFAVLQASNSEGGQRMLNRGHRLEVGQTGIVGNVALTGKPRITLDVGADAVFFDNPDLPTTRSEMSLPLNVRGVTIGVLDVQSTKAGEFTESDASTLGVLADHIAIAIENARLFAKTQQALNEVQTLYNQYLQKEWKSFRSESANVGYQQSLTGGKPLETLVESDDIRSAVQSGETILASEDTQTEPAIVVPIKLRGQTIGVLNVKGSSKARRWSRDEINMIQAVSDRLALALESARLFEETNRRAERERLVSDITGKIRSVNDPQAMIQTAMDELRNALGASHVQVIPQAVKENK